MILARKVPCLIVCSRIYPFSDTSKMEARSIHYTFHLESANRIVELVFHATHPLTFNGKVENCLFSVLMSEGKYVIFGFDAVGKGLAVLWYDPFVGALLTFGLCHSTVFVAPTLIAEGDFSFLLGLCRNKHNGGVYICPNFN